MGLGFNFFIFFTFSDCVDQSPNQQLYNYLLAYKYVYFNFNLLFSNEISLDETCNNNIEC